MKSYISEGVNAVQYVFAALQTNETLKAIELVLSIVVSIVLISYRVYKWYKLAKSDGKITKEEIEDLTKSIEKDVDDLKDKIDGDGKE